jgi:hypothetical protein
VLGDDDVTENKMFGGITFRCGGNVAVGIVGELMVRVGKERFAEARWPSRTRERWTSPDARVRGGVRGR